jgi:hypothetical protein
MIRYHSCYPWHNKGEYEWAYAPGDEEIKAAVLRLNRFDLELEARALPPYPPARPVPPYSISTSLIAPASWHHESTTGTW